MSTTTARSGYILLITILFIGAIASAILSSLLLLGISANQISLSVQESAQALSAAHGCAEYALIQLRESPSYNGNETLVIDDQECSIRLISGFGNNNRFLCTEGTSGDSIRRLEISIQQLLPVTTMYSWQEVSLFSLCS